MDKTDVPASFGVFKPLGHTLMAFRTAQDTQAATSDVLEQGLEQGLSEPVLPKYCPSLAHAFCHGYNPLFPG